ncbi:hypothetical protein [Pseudoroseomonas ludipueritiae]|uniref:Uncharacterized protein n=1 Tax=Pseudoroseomonas ludipueritiae TaxID=198093 RepID=A0ABR7R292_9PROT|nr:hypothetical protein [Pseudoroseomonas ludipueritiae]MBC9175849.1 hypothetical protein [Pseudoroseomonas ludipueritiae]MCG7360195.1 hypothetical protein [Roseomonas sp. ACRSG]
MQILQHPAGECRSPCIHVLPYRLPLQEAKAVLLQQAAHRTQVLEGADLVRDGLSVGGAFLESLDQRVVTAPQDLHPGIPQLPQDSFKGAGVIEHGVAFGFHDDGLRRLHRRRWGRGAREARHAGITAHALDDLDGGLPHILQRIGVDARRGLGKALPLTPVDGALGRLQRDVVE